MWGSLIPLVAQGLGMWFGGRQAKKAQEQALARSPEERAALTGAQNIAGTAASTAGSLIQQGRPYLQQPANYYQTLLSGNRAAMNQAVAAPMATISGQYRGAERGIERSGLRGAARDEALGELNRQRVGQLAGLTTGVQPAAAAGLAGLGSDLLRSATPLYGTAGNIYTSLLNEGLANRRLAYEEGEKSGKAWGDLITSAGKSIYDILNKRDKDKTEPPLDTTPKVPIESGVPANLPGQVPMPLPPVTLPPATGEGGRTPATPRAPAPTPTTPTVPGVPGRVPGRDIPIGMPQPGQPSGGGTTFPIPTGGRRLRYFTQFGGPY